MSILFLYEGIVSVWGIEVGNSFRPMSFYLPDSKALFLHIPRSGGTWVKSAIKLCGIEHVLWGRFATQKQYGGKHVTLPCYNSQLMSKVEFVFAFVRHPVFYYESLWKYVRKELEDERYRHRRTEKMGRNITHGGFDFVFHTPYVFHLDFEEWLFYLLQFHPCSVTRLFERFVGPYKGEYCHFIGRTESLIDDFTEVMTILGYKDQLGELKKLQKKVNVTDEKRLCSDRMIAEIEKGEVSIIRRFYGEQTKSNRWYSSLDPLHRRCPGRCPKSILALRRKLYPNELQKGDV